MLEEINENDQQNANEENGIQKALNASDPAGEDTGGNSTAVASEDAAAEQPNPAADPAVNAADKPRPAWFQKRIDALTAEKHQERREKEAAKAQAAALLEQLAEARKPSAAATSADPAAQAAASSKPEISLSEAEIEARATAKADEIARVRAFTKACNDTYNAGKDEFDDFDRTINTFSMFNGIPNSVLDIVTDMPKGHAVLYALGKDPDLIEKVVKMSPAKQALELARLEAGLNKPVAKAISNAPAPVKPLDGSGRSEEDPSKMSMEDFVAWRAKTARKR